jgi:hypothetical protein
MQKAACTSDIKVQAAFVLFEMSGKNIGGK